MLNPFDSDRAGFGGAGFGAGAGQFAPDEDRELRPTSRRPTRPRRPTTRRRSRRRRSAGTCGPRPSAAATTQWRSERRRQRQLLRPDRRGRGWRRLQAHPRHADRRGARWRRHLVGLGARARQRALAMRSRPGSMAHSGSAPGISPPPPRLPTTGPRPPATSPCRRSTRSTPTSTRRAGADALEGGYRFAWGTLNLTPYAAFQAQSFSTPNYSEASGSGSNQFALSYASRTGNVERGELGSWAEHALSASGQFGREPVRPRRLGARLAEHPAGERHVPRASPIAAFIVNGAKPAADLGVVTAGAELRMASGWAPDGQVRRRVRLRHADLRRHRARAIRVVMQFVLKRRVTYACASRLAPTPDRQHHLKDRPVRKVALNGKAGRRDFPPPSGRSRAPCPYRGISWWRRTDRKCAARSEDRCRCRNLRPLIRQSG